MDLFTTMVEYITPKGFVYKGEELYTKFEGVWTIG